MLVAVLESMTGAIGRNVDFSRNVFAAEGLGEVTIDDLRQFDANGRLAWVSEEMRALALSYSPSPRMLSADSGSVVDDRLDLGVETEVVYVPAHRFGSKADAELRRIVDDMTLGGWFLVEDTRLGASGGHLTFHRAAPFDAAFLASMSFAT